VDVLAAANRVTRPDVRGVDAGAASDLVVPWPAVDDVVAVAGEDRVVAAEPIR
jgi:hypothetical protein